MESQKGLKEEFMPNICLFYGILISMRYSDHNPPHFHAIYQGHKGMYNFDGELLEGSMPEKQNKLIMAWCELHREDLEANWKLASEHEALFKIEPLR